MVWEVYIRDVRESENGIKVVIGVFDNEDQADPRWEETYELNFPPNQPDEYIRSEIKKFLANYKAKKQDSSNKRDLIGESFT